MSRTLQDALKRAEALRDFRKVNSGAFERNEDFQDIVVLADSYIGMRDAMDEFNRGHTGWKRNTKEDHDESW